MGRAHEGEQRPLERRRRERRIDRTARINEAIRIREVRLIDAEGGQVGIVPTDQALRMAREAGFDLVEVAPAARPPVCRIMDFGKFLYQQKKKAQESRKKQKRSSNLCDVPAIPASTWSVTRFVRRSKRASSNPCARSSRVVCARSTWRSRTEARSWSAGNRPKGRGWASTGRVWSRSVS